MGCRFSYIINIKLIRNEILRLLAGKSGSYVTSLLIILVSDGSKKDELGRIDLHSKG